MADSSRSLDVSDRAPQSADRASESGSGSGNVHGTLIQASGDCPIGDIAVEQQVIESLVEISPSEAMAAAEVELFKRLHSVMRHG